jgi:hypothetical protein
MVHRRGSGSRGRGRACRRGMLVRRSLVRLLRRAGVRVRLTGDGRLLGLGSRHAGRRRIWNKEHPGIQVDFTQIVSSAATTKIQTAVQAGNAPCLAQVSYDDVLSYVADGLLQNVTSEAKQYRRTTSPGCGTQVSPEATTYGIPQDIGPVVMYYRADLFKKYGITVPATWSEYAADAGKVHKKDPSVVLGTLSPDDADMFQALTWQNKAVWWSVQGNTWVASTSPAARAGGRHVLAAADQLRRASRSSTAGRRRSTRTCTTARSCPTSAPPGTPR